MKLAQLQILPNLRDKAAIRNITARPKVFRQGDQKNGIKRG